MDLKPFVGKRVVLQLKPGSAYFVCAADKGPPTVYLQEGPLDRQTGRKQLQPVGTPFLLGDVVLHNGAAVLRVSDEAGKSGRKLLLMLDDLVGVAVAVSDEPADPPPPAPEPAEPSRIVMP